MCMRQATKGLYNIPYVEKAFPIRERWVQEMALPAAYQVAELHRKVLLIGWLFLDRPLTMNVFAWPLNKSLPPREMRHRFFNILLARSADEVSL